MPVSQSIRDIEQGNPEEDSQHPLLGAGLHFSNGRNLEGFRLEFQGFDVPLPTRSTKDKNHLRHSTNDLTGLTETNISEQDGWGRQKELNARLLTVINKAKVDIEVLESLISEGADPNAFCRDHNGDVYACYLGGLFDSESRTLVKNLSFLSHASEDWTPLHAAAYRALKQPVELLLAAGADPNICDEAGRTALDVAGLANCVGLISMADSDNLTEVVRLIINSGGQYNTMKEGGFNKARTPLHTAVKLRNKDLVEELLLYGASAACWDEEGQTPLQMCVGDDQIEEILKILVAKAPDVQDHNGVTVLRASVEAGWLPGVRIALEAGADVTLKASDGEAPIHAAAMNIPGWYDDFATSVSDDEIPEKTVLHEILKVAKKKNVVDYPNRRGITALFHAVIKGSRFSVKNFLDEGSSITYTTRNNLSVFHLAARYGHRDILKMLLDFDKTTTKLMINSLTTPALKGFAPIHLAVLKNHLSCVEMLVERKADVCLKTNMLKESTTALHMAAVNDNVEIAKCILRSFNFLGKLTPIEQFDGNGWLPLHTAIYNRSENTVKLLLKHNASLASQTQCENPKTALDMIMQNITNPTDFLEDLLDSCISLDGAAKSKINLDYQLVTPNRDQKAEIDVIEALLNTGNEFKQKRLLLHPLIESCIYIKWQTMKRYYIFIAAIYAMFVASLVIFEITVFLSIDNHKTKLGWTKIMAGGCVIIFFILLIISQELLMNVDGRRYFWKPENWIKLGSLGLAIILPPAIMVLEWEQAEWPRHVASGALLLACLQILNIISQFPSGGYYVVMFKKVVVSVLKILGTFAILIFGFAITFMIQFRSQIPFDGPWDAFVKIIFFLIGEFDYNSLFSKENAEKLGSSFQVARILLVVFVILAVIVIMNMMVNIALDDINDLKSDGNSGRLEKQARFICLLDRPDSNITNILLRFLPERYCKLMFPDITDLDEQQLLPKRFIDAFFSIAQKNKEKKNEKEMKDFKTEAENNYYDKTMERLDKMEVAMNKNIERLTEDSLLIKKFLVGFKEIKLEEEVTMKNSKDNLSSAKRRNSCHI